MKKIILKAILVAIVLQQFTLALQQLQRININQSYRLKSSPNKFQTFRIAQSGLKPNTQYNIKISYIGSIGLQLKIYWKSDEKNKKVASEFKPLDTERLHFYTNKKSQILNISSESRDEINQEYLFTLVGYRNTRSRDLEAKNQDFEYILKIEEVVIDNVPIYILQQLVLCVVTTIIVVYFISVSYFKKNGFLNNLFSNNPSLEGKKNQ
ncbi:hypothetical protein ABPG72_009547 [Tetrahymena utriculariae]